MFLGEVVGTAVLILLGDGVVAGVLLKGSKSRDGGWIVVAFAWAMAVLFGVLASKAVAGGVAHLNPAVTVAFAYAGSVQWADVPMLIAGQFLGAFIGAALVYLAYLAHWEGTDDQGQKLAVFCTAPAIRKTVPNLITEIIGTAMLVIGISAVNANPGAAPLGFFFVALLVLGIGLSLGGPTGYAINPARDLGPRIMHAILPIPGKGTSDWDYAWIPVAGPIVGGVLAIVVLRFAGLL
jgi:glycerol uptake facilitator protein